MKVKFLFNYDNLIGYVKLILYDGAIDLVMEDTLDNFPTWVGELDVLSTKKVDGILYIEASVPLGKHWIL